MGSYFWKTVLVLGALSASGRCALSHQLLRYDEAVSQGVVLYNSKAEEDSFYRLLEAVPQPEWDPNSEGTQELKFTIKETVCPAGKEHFSDECNFKEDGVVRECTATYFLQEKPPLAFVSCDAVEGIEEEEEEEEEEDQPERFKKLKKLFKKIKKGAKKGIKIVTKTGAQIFLQKQILGKITG
ncbi:cathelicidin-related peptide Oh-Cath-like [Crotalus tigris]|uniref:cathelicidin-related peptide Oh-Cath-like n=1 Tax=Crotalus tigris TaxID=88082 RepID=UPI00192FAA0E|nr:cathelicidin-related peptide Oh-Cath-like [Crotalus tigris]XP_039224748.1 cathelicidin-related peptide Oh-Cath-like [Crotalus tigris]